MKLNEFEFLTFINDNEEAINDLKPNHTQKLFFERINKEINDYNDNYRNSNNDFETDEQMRCRYYDATDFNNSKFDKTNNFSLLHLNIHSIQAHFEDLLILLNSLNIKFDVIALSESKLNDEPTTNINIPGYHPPIFTFTESTKGGTMLYVEENINFKPRKDLEIYDPKNLESTFIEIINPNESNSIVGVIYRHPCMDCTYFTNEKFSGLLNKLTLQKNKKIYLAGDFNFDLLKTSTNSETSEFYEKITANLLTPLITIPTKLNRVDNTLIDNILTNEFKSDTISGNLTDDISDHLPSFIISP